jgi:TonB family protein
VVGGLVASLIVHGTVVVTLMVTPAMHTGHPKAPPQAAGQGQGEAPEPMDPACLLDEALQAGARAALCLTPWQGERSACLDGALAAMTEGKIACRNLARPVELTMIEPVELIPGIEPRKEEEEKDLVLEAMLEEEKKEEQAIDPSGQVVEIAPPAVEQRPDQANFVSEYDSSVEKEMKKMGKPVEQAGAVAPMAMAPQPTQQPQQQPPADAKPQGAQSGTGALGMRRPDAPPSAPGRDGETNGDDVEKEMGAVDGLAPEDGGELARLGGGGGLKRLDAVPARPPGEDGEGGDGRPLSARDLRPNSEQLARATSGSFDALDDVDEGNDTQLNTKRWVYANFFNRVKRAVADSWKPAEIYALRDPTGKIYGYKDRITLVKVSLKPDGSLANVAIEKPCGVDFLDDEAVRAFKDAGPFPNPPGALVDKVSNLITFRFGFQFQVSASPSWKVFRYQ